MRREGVDPRCDAALVRRIAESMVRDHDDRSLTGAWFGTWIGSVLGMVDADALAIVVGAVLGTLIGMSARNLRPP